MSNRTFEELLREVLVELREVIEYEKPPDAQILPKDKLEVMRFYEMHYSSLYVRYLMIYKKLEVCVHISIDKYITTESYVERNVITCYYNHKRDVILS